MRIIVSLSDVTLLDFAGFIRIYASIRTFSLVYPHFADINLKQYMCLLETIRPYLDMNSCKPSGVFSIGRRYIGRVLDSIFLFIL